MGLVLKRGGGLLLFILTLPSAIFFCLCVCVCVCVCVGGGVFDISEWLIQFNTATCSNQINRWCLYIFIWLHGCLILLASVCAVCLCMCVWYKIRVPALKAYYVSDLSKLETLLQGLSDTKVPRFNMCRSIIS